MRRGLLLLLLLAAAALLAAPGAGATPTTDGVSTSGSTTVGVNKKTHIQTIIMQDENTLRSSRPSWKRGEDKTEERSKAHHRRMHEHHSAVERARNKEDVEKAEVQRRAQLAFHRQQMEARGKQIAEERDKVRGALAARHKAVEAETKEARMKVTLKRREAALRRRQESAKETRAKRDARFARAEERKAKREDEEERKSSAVRVARGYRAYGRGFQAPVVLRFGTLCKVHGLLRGAAGLAAVLGRQCRAPEGRLVFSATQSDRHVRVDVLPDGRVYWIPRTNGARRVRFLSLDGIAFDTVHRGRPRPALGAGWASYGREFRPAQVSKHGGVCVLSMMLRGTRWRGALARLPAACRPLDGHLVTVANNHERASRVDLRADGSVVVAGGGRNHGWVSVQAVYTPTGGNWLTLGAGWNHLGRGYRPCMWARRGPLCVLSGLARPPPAWTNPVARLPASCRPRAVTVFPGMASRGAFCRVDVHPSGVVSWHNCAHASGFLTLSGIAFVAV